MKSWIRRVVPDLFLAAVVALLVMVAIQQLEGVESARMRSETHVASEDGLTLDERIEVVGGSIRRSALLHGTTTIDASAVMPDTSESGRLSIAM